MAQPPEPRGDAREPAPTASGLDESQIDPADLQALQDSVRLHALPLEIAGASQPLLGWAPVLPPQSLKQVALEIGCPPLPRLHIAPLPTRVKVQRLALPPVACKLKRDLQLALRQPIRRRRMVPIELPKDKLKALFTALHDKYGDAAQGMEVRCVFAHIPPEAAGAISVDPGQAWAAFCVADAALAKKARAGFYLVVVLDDKAETRKVLLRL